MIIVMLVFTSCEEQKPLLLEKDKSALKSGKELAKMSQAELSDYFKSIDLTQITPGYTETWTDTLSAEEFAKYKSIISLRSSEQCGVVVTPYINSGGPDSAYVTVYEAGTSTIYRAKEKLADGEDFWMEIDGADYYDFVTEHPTNPTGSISGTLEIDPDWGGKTLAPFSGNGPHTYYNYNFECPPESTDGTCDAYVSVYKKSGGAQSYNIMYFPSSGSPGQVLNISGDPQDSYPFTCDQTETYEFYIYSLTGTTSETFDVSIIRPDGIAHGYNFFYEDMTNGKLIKITEDFNYFDCPY